MIMNIVNLIYIIKAKPLESKGRNQLEIFNELCIIVMTSSLFVFTDFVEDPYIKYNCGWFFIGMFMFNLGVNGIIILVDTIQ